MCSDNPVGRNCQLAHTQDLSLSTVFLLGVDFSSSPTSKGGRKEEL